MLRQAYRAIARSVDTPRTVDGSAPRASESASQGGENSTARKDTRSYSQPRPCTQGLRNLGPHFSHAPGHSFFGGRLGDFGGALHHRREDDRNVKALFHGSSHKSWLRGHRSDSHLCWRAIRGGGCRGRGRGRVRGRQGFLHRRRWWQRRWPFESQSAVSWSKARSLVGAPVKVIHNALAATALGLGCE